DDLFFSWIGSRPGRISLNSTHLVAVPILTPLPDVPIHVVQSPRIGQLLPDRMNSKIENREIQEPRVIRQAAVTRIVSITKPRRSAGACGAFPRGLGGEAVLAAGGDAPRRDFLLRKLSAVVRRVGPSDAGNRPTQIARKVAWILSDDRQVLG